MRAFDLTISQPFRRGLNPEQDTPINGDFLSICRNVRVEQTGLHIPRDITMPFTGGAIPTFNFPFPQVFRGKDLHYLCFDQSVESVDSNWTRTEQLGNLTIVGGGGVWDFADFYDVVFFCNQSNIVYRTRRSSLLGGADTFADETFFTAHTCCAHNGRLVFGRLDSSGFWDTAINTFFQTWLSKMSIPFGTTEQTLVNYVWWSSIGLGDVEMMFDKDLAVSGVLSAYDSKASIDRPVFFEFLRRNESGMAPMTFRRNVMAVKPLGPIHIVVYGEDGISLMTAYKEPYPTYGITHVSDVGIAQKGAVCGDDNRHFFLDNDGELWTIGTDFIPQRIGYKDDLTDALDETIIASWDGKHKTAYFAWGTGGVTTNGAMITENGLSMLDHSKWRPTSGFYSEGAFVGIADATDETDLSMVASTETIVLGPGLQTILFARPEGILNEAEADIHVDTWYRKRSDDSWGTTGYKDLDAEGVAHPRATGHEFQFHIQVVAPGTATVLQGVTITYQTIDKRYRRGIDVTRADARAGS